LGYVIAAVLVVVGIFAAIVALYVRYESRPTARPTMPGVRKAVPRPRRVAAGDRCLCGGNIGQSGKTSVRFGDLLGCTRCSRSWHMDGRRLIRRRIAAGRPAGGPAD
jgi:hypothetical protein